MPQQPCDLARLDVQGQAIHSMLHPAICGAEVLVQVADPDSGGTCSRTQKQAEGSESCASKLQQQCLLLAQIPINLCHMKFEFLLLQAKQAAHQAAPCTSCQHAHREAKQEIAHCGGSRLGSDAAALACSRTASMEGLQVHLLTIGLLMRPHSWISSRLSF